MLIVCMTFVALGLGYLRHMYEYERGIVESIGPSTFFARHDEPVVWLSLGPPDAIGFYRWNGPAFLEKPMRVLGIPWFDRIERISIYSDEKMPTSTWVAITQLQSLKSIELEDPT